MKAKYQKKDVSIYGEQNVEDSLSYFYNENTKLNSYQMRILGERINNFFNNDYLVINSNFPYKIYPNSKTIDLNNYINFDPQKLFLDVLKNRESVRNYKDYKISLNEITSILYNSYGRINKKELIKRNVPSAGSLYPLEIYLVTFNSHIPNGIYHYNVIDNKLELITEGDFLDYISKNVWAEPLIELKKSSAVLVTTGILERLYLKYNERAYRFMLHESGFVAQNISLISESLSLGTCMMGGYNDEKINQILGIDGVFESITNILTIGKK